RAAAVAAELEAHPVLGGVDDVGDLADLKLPGPLTADADHGDLLVGLEHALVHARGGQRLGLDVPGGVGRHRLGRLRALGRAARSGAAAGALGRVLVALVVELVVGALGLGLGRIAVIAVVDRVDVDDLDSLV